MSTNPVEVLIDSEMASATAAPKGKIGQIAAKYTNESPRLLGFLLTLSYDDMQVVTCDPWKQKCGGAPRNSFVVAKLNPTAAASLDPRFAERLLLARIMESVPTPVQSDIQNTIFQVHKVQAIVDPMTNKELQWGALKATVLGTYYDDYGTVSFGNDVDSFMAPHFYEVYVPTDEDLSVLLNSFVQTTTPLEIGALRYTETPPVVGAPAVPILVNPDDFVGYDSGHRTALFGKTRMGKSNTIKVVADTILQSPREVGQIIFDPSGEYTYINEQDGTSIYALHQQKCVRYSLNPRLPQGEADLHFQPPHELKINFFENIVLGHSIIKSLFSAEFQDKPPGYLIPVLDWEPTDPVNAPTNHGDEDRYWRSVGLYYANLVKASYQAPSGQKYNKILVPLRANVKKELAEDTAVQAVANLTTNAAGDSVIDERQPLSALKTIYAKVWPLWRLHKGKKDWFPPSSDGSDYFDGSQASMLRMLGDDQINGAIYLRPFNVYHSLTGSNVISEIVSHVDSNRTVLIDYANASEEVARNFSDKICRAVLAKQMHRFAHNALGDHFVVFYFEEAHTLFRADDKDLSSTYNKLAKEGAKFHISMVYATQSMTTLSPDLLKNTENFFIGHLNDDREIKEVTRRYEFKDIAEDVQRCRTKGYVRMITLSHRFALPVRIKKFAPPDGSMASGPAK